MSFPRLAGALALAALLLLAPDAFADVATTDITSVVPLAGGVYTWQQGAAPLVISGTSTGGAAGDKVDVRCYRHEAAGLPNSSFIGQATIDAVTGDWSVTVPPPGPGADAPAFYGPCVLRGLPETFDAASMFDAAAFSGARLLPRYDAILRDPNSTPYDDVWGHETDRGYADTFSAGSCGLCDMALWNPATQQLSRTLFYGDAFLLAWNYRTGRSDVTVDGQPAVDTFSSRNLGITIGLPGSTSLAATIDQHPDGTADITESQDLGRCTNPGGTPQTSADCGGLTPDGVTLVRTLHTSDGNTRAVVTDDWTSNDAAPHLLDVRYTEDLEPGGATRFTLPGAAGPVASFTGPQAVGPVGTVYIDADAATPDGSFAEPQGAVTIAGPNAAVQEGGSDGFVTAFTATVPAGGSVRIVHEYNLAADRATVVARAQAAEARLTAPATPTPTPTPAAPVIPAAPGTPPPLVAPAIVRHRTAPRHDTRAPRFTSAPRLTRRRFRVAQRSTALSAAARRGTKIRYALDERATVTFAIQRRTTGRRAGKACRRTTRRNRARRHCTRYVRIRTLRRRARAGHDTLTFTGRISRHALHPGRYRFVIVATDAHHNRSRPRRLSFRIVRR